jgi:hypothetical protein
MVAGKRIGTEEAVRRSRSGATTMNGRMIMLGPYVHPTESVLLLPLGFATGPQPELRQSYLLYAEPMPLKATGGEIAHE